MHLLLKDPARQLIAGAPRNIPYISRDALRLAERNRNNGQVNRRRSLHFHDAEYLKNLLLDPKFCSDAVSSRGAQAVMGDLVPVRL